MSGKIGKERIEQAIIKAIIKALIESPCCRNPQLTTLLTIDGQRRAYCHTCKTLVPKEHKRRITRPCPMCDEPHGIDEHDFNHRFLCKCGYMLEFSQDDESIILDYPRP